MYKSQLEVREWLELPQSTRVKLASDFNLMRSGNSEVMDHRVISDGFLYGDLSRISVDLIRAKLNLTNDEFDFYNLFNLLLQSYEHKREEGSEIKGADQSTDGADRKEQEIEQVREGSVLPSDVEKPKKRRGRPAYVRNDRDGDQRSVR